MMAASGTRPTVPEPCRRQGTVWHTLRVRARAVTALAVVAAAGTLAASAPARTSASARAEGAVVSGTLGAVAHVKVSGDDGTSRSAPSNTPGGIELSGGSVSVFSTRTGSASAQAAAQASDVELLGGAVSASLVQRTATDDGNGVRYGGTVSGLKIQGKAVAPRAGVKYPLADGAGYVVTGALGKGLEVRLTAAVNGFPAGTDVVVADVSAHAVLGSTPAPTATPQATA